MALHCTVFGGGQRAVGGYETRSEDKGVVLHLDRLLVVREQILFFGHSISSPIGSSSSASATSYHESS